MISQTRIINMQCEIQQYLPKVLPRGDFDPAMMQPMPSRNRWAMINGELTSVDDSHADCLSCAPGDHTYMSIMPRIAKTLQMKLYELNDDATKYLVSLTTPDGFCKEVTYLLRCTRCGVEHESHAPVRKMINVVDCPYSKTRGDHAWTTPGQFHYPSVVFCYHCSAVKRNDDGQVRESGELGRICDLCGPESPGFTYTGGFPSNSGRGEYRYGCQRCGMLAKRFSWHPVDCPTLFDFRECVVMPSELPTSDAVMDALCKNFVVSCGRMCDCCGKIIQSEFRECVATVNGITYLAIVQGGRSGRMNDGAGFAYIESQFGPRKFSVVGDICKGCAPQYADVCPTLLTTLDAYNRNNEVASGIQKMLQ